MFVFKNKKFQLHQTTDKLNPIIEISGLSILLENALEEDNFELAIIIRDKIKSIKNDESKGRS
jgi:protein-arginine kinase activator protein McsA